MANTISRRSFLKKSIGALVTAAALGSGGYFYAGKVEPQLVNVSKLMFSHKDIPVGFQDFRIVQFSDTHLGFQYDLIQLKEVVNKINSLTPDILFFTGDLMDAPNEYDKIDEIVPVLQKLKAPFGKFAVYGNHDHGGYGSDIYKEVMENAGFKLLINEASEVKLLNNEHFYIVGIDDAMLGNPDIEKALEAVPNDSFKLLLSHAPDLADDAEPYNIQLQLSGHSHGGQVKIPFIGALVKPPFAEKYYEGLYAIGENNDLTLYVNRGLGTTRLPFRFLSKPEITLFTLNSN